jgi:hypothetical protein
MLPTFKKIVRIFKFLCLKKLLKFGPLVWNIPFAHYSRLWSWFLFTLIYICGKIFCTRYLFVHLFYACKVVVQINGLSVKSWSQKGHMLYIFSCNVECIFCTWKFWLCVWPICAKQVYLQTVCPLFHVIVLRHTLLNMFCSISDSYIKLQNSFCPNS